jgi:hypothetical protein
MTSGQSTVIFVQSSAHWEALQKQKYASKHEEKESLPTETIRVKSKKSPAVVKERNTMLTGKEGSRRKQRWTNSK